MSYNQTRPPDDRYMWMLSRGEKAGTGCLRNVIGLSQNISWLTAGTLWTQGKETEAWVAIFPEDSHFCPTDTLWASPYSMWVSKGQLRVGLQGILPSPLKALVLQPAVHPAEIFCQNISVSLCQAAPEVLALSPPAIQTRWRKVGHIQTVQAGVGRHCVAPHLKVVAMTPQHTATYQRGQVTQTLLVGGVWWAVKNFT